MRLKKNEILDRQPMSDKEYEAMIQKFYEENKCFESKKIIDELKAEEGK